MLGLAGVLNGGGDINTYPYLLQSLKSRAVNKRGKLVVLIGRTTYSAAVPFGCWVTRVLVSSASRTLKLISAPG